MVKRNQNAETYEERVRRLTRERVRRHRQKARAPGERQQGEAMRTAIVIEVDGSVHELERVGEKPTLEELHKAVGGYIEVVRADVRGTLMVVNEEGLVHGLPVNRLASLLYGYERHGQPIVGPAILIDAKLLD